MGGNGPNGNSETDASRSAEGVPSGGGYKSGYLLQLTEEVFKYIFFLLFIVFGAIYYATAIMPPDYSPVKYAGLYFIVYVIFAIFYILLPVRRMLFSNLQIYREKLMLTSRYDRVAKLAAEAVEAAVKARDESAGAGNSGAPGYRALVTFRTDYYVAFAPIFVSLVISMILYAAFSLSGAGAHGGLDARRMDWIAVGLLAAGFVAIAAGFAHFINRAGSTHRGFVLLLIFAVAAFSAFLFAGSPFFAACPWPLVGANAVAALGYAYVLRRGGGLTVFVRTPDRNIYMLAAGPDSRSISQSSLRRVEFGTVCRFVQTPFAIGFTVCDRDEPSGFGDLYYCDTSKENVELVCEVFADRIDSGPAAGAGNVRGDGAPGYFTPVGVTGLARKYGAGQTMILLLINAVSMALAYQIASSLVSVK